MKEILTKEMRSKNISILNYKYLRYSYLRKLLLARLLHHTQKKEIMNSEYFSYDFKFDEMKTIFKPIKLDELASLDQFPAIMEAAYFILKKVKNRHISIGLVLIKIIEMA